jgi:hypothetical protein
VKRSLVVLYALPLATLGGQQAIPAAKSVATFQYGAETTAPARRQGAVSASGINWNCQDSRCTTSGSWATPAVGACNALAQQVGPVRSYGHQGGMLTPGELQQCNAGVPTNVGTGPTRSITADDFTLRAQPLPNAPYRVAPPQGTPLPRTSVSPSKVGPVQKSVVIDAGTFRYVGGGRVMIDAGTLRYVGGRSVVIDAGTLRYVGPPR